MYIRHSYESEFEHLYLDLKDKYPKQIFQLEGIDESQLDVTQFSKNYFLKKNVADASIDQNANVQIKTVATYKSEVHKGEDKLNSLYLIWKTAKKLYGTRIANRLIEEEVCKDLNIQDSSNSFLPYCFAFDTIDVVTNGLPFITNMPSGPAKHADTFLRHCEQLIMFASHQLMGATAIPNALVIYSALLKIDSLDDTYPVYNYKTQPEMFDKYIRQEFQKFIYTLNQPIRQVQCVDEETEVLTPSGFKDYKSLNVNDDIYTWDNGALNVQKVDAVNVYDYDGEMHIYEGRDIFQQVSPDHRVLYKKFNTSDFELKQSKDLIEFKTPIDIPIVPSIVKIEDYSISDNDIIMSVFILTDGCFIKRKDGSRRTYIQIFKSDNRWGGEELEKILNEENIEYKKSYRKSGFEADGYNAEEHKVGIYSISTESSQKYVELLNENKSDIPDIFLNMSQRQSKLFIDTWSQLDGSIVNDRDKLQCDNYNIADKIQHICFRAGIGSRIAPRLIGNNKKETVYVLLYKNTIKSASKKYKIDYKGKIWCPTTNDGVVFFRKNGKIFVSGNSAFTNITIFDSIFLKELCKMYVIGGDTIDPEFAMFVQKKFLQFFNEFNRERIFTFPVLTVQFKKDSNNELEDKEFFEYICDVNTEFANLNIFSASNLTALSSCCFDEYQKVLVKSSSSGVNHISFKELYELPYSGYKNNLRIAHNGSWVSGKIVKVPLKNKKMFKVTTVNNKELMVTEDHIHLTLDGDKKTSDITLNDYLVFNCNIFDEIPENDMCLTYEQGVLIGAYLGDGSKYKHKNCNSVRINFSLNKEKYEELFPIFEKALRDFNIRANINVSSPYNNVYPLYISSVDLSNKIEYWVSGNYCYEKELNLNCLLQSPEFRRGIIYGMYITDGGNSNRIYSSSKKLIDQIEIVLMSLGMVSVINLSDRREEDVIIREEKFNRNNIVYCIRYYTPQNKRKQEGIYKIKNNSIGFKLKHIEEITDYNKEFVYCFEIYNNDEPYFTLPSGIITHNCRLINNIEDLIQATKEENMNLIGGSSIKVGSFGVTTLNLPRIAIKSKKDTELFFDELRRLCEDAFMINNCRRELIIKMIEQDQLPLYSSGFMNLDNQYSTLGILGIFETVEIMGFDNISCDGKNFAISILKFIDEIVKNKIKKYGYRCNVEQIPAEATSPKLAKVDKILYKQDKYKLYSNQFLPLTTETDILNRIELQELYERYFSGGTILHVNVANKIKSKRVMKKLMEYVIKSGVQYFAVNYFFQKCKNGHLTIDSSIMCNICGGEVIERYTRIVGFLTPVSSWQEERREEFYDRKRYSEDVLPQIQSEERIKNVS